MYRTVIQRGISVGVAVLILALGACQRGPTMQPLPKRASAWPDAALVLVWHGRGEGYRMKGGDWQRAPTQDYDFTVVQRRYGDVWESTKTMQRRHPKYDGSAGPRAQTYHFTIRYGVDEGDPAAFAVNSTLGSGLGHTDEEFREANLYVDADISSHAPFNRYTIDQHYDYEAGTLNETVTLVKHTSKSSKPWAKVEESAAMFGAKKFAEAPSRLTAALPGSPDRR